MIRVKKNTKGDWMTKAFLEPLVLKPENEKFIREAYSEKNMNRVKHFDAIKRPKLTKTKDRKLSIADLL